MTKGIHNPTRKLLAAMEATAAPLGVARGLPNETYASEDLFEFEREHILGSSWAAIGFGREVAGPGYVKPVEFMNMPLLMVRDKQDTLRVFHNVCSHRGMLLVHEETQCRAVIRCPYHSWSYDFDGKLLATPHVGGIEKNQCAGFDQTEHGLRPIRCAVWMDIVFVNLSGDAETFEEFIAPLENRWQPFLGGRNSGDIMPATTGSTLELALACNWKLATENYCEAYHLPWIHPDLDSYSPLDQHFNITDGDNISGQGTHVYELAKSAGTTLPTIHGWPAEKLKYAEYISLYPNALLGLQADHFFAVIVLPKSAARSCEKLQISYVGDGVSSNDYASCRSKVLASWEKVFREDIFAVEGLQAGRNSPGFDGGVLTPLQDVPTHHFHMWVARRYAHALV